MHSPEEIDAIWTADAKAKIQQEFGWSGAALLEKYRLFLDAGGWAHDHETVEEAFAEWARKRQTA